MTDSNIERNTPRAPKKQKLVDNMNVTTAIVCGGCNENTPIHGFSDEEQQKGFDLARCDMCCTQEKKECATCHQLKTKVEYNNNGMWKQDNRFRQCSTCQQDTNLNSQVEEELPAKEEELRLCSSCNIEKTMKLFSLHQWNAREISIRICIECKKKERVEQLRLSKERLATRKRQVEELLKRAEGRERVENLPRMCATCRIKKPKEEFSESQWGDYYCTNETNRECIACVTKAEIEEAQDLLEREQGAIHHALKLYRKNGCVSYDFQRCEFFPLKSPSTSLEVGTYDIIFNALYGSEYFIQRTCKGTMNVTADTKNEQCDDNQKGILYRGIVQLEGVANDYKGSGFGEDFRLEQIESDQYGFRVTGKHADVSMKHCRTDKILATVQEIDCNVSLAWFDERISDEDPLGVDEAQELMAKSISVHYENSWILNHLPLTNPDIVRKIHEYTTWKPDPVFIIEPGDLWIRVIWDEIHPYDTRTSYLIARRRQGS